MTRGPMPAQSPAPAWQPPGDGPPGATPAMSRRRGARVTVVRHPLVQHKLTLLRDRATGVSEFRRLLRELGLLMAYEACRDLPLGRRRIRTPLAPMDAPVLDGKKLVLVPVLRAGLGLAEGMQALLPAARVAHLGLYRDPRTLAAVEYYFKAPRQMARRDAIVADPMLATGHSAAAALSRIRQAGARSVRFVCLVAAPEGLAYVRRRHPGVPIYTAAVDEGLNAHAYIVPGLGDAGDRLFGTR
jgi:uracil phosphoribosyltransferase